MYASFLCLCRLLDWTWHPSVWGLRGPNMGISRAKNMGERGGGGWSAFWNIVRQDYSFTSNNLSLLWNLVGSRLCKAAGEGFKFSPYWLWILVVQGGGRRLQILPYWLLSASLMSTKLSHTFMWMQGWQDWFL